MIGCISYNCSRIEHQINTDLPCLFMSFKALEEVGPSNEKKPAKSGLFWRRETSGLEVQRALVNGQGRLFGGFA